MRNTWFECRKIPQNVEGLAGIVCGQVFRDAPYRFTLITKRLITFFQVYIITNLSHQEFSLESSAVDKFSSFY